MAQDVHVTTAGVVFHSDGRSPANPNAGKPVTVVKDGSGKIVSTAGQVTGTSVIHTNPA